MFSHLNATDRRLYLTLFANFIVLGVSMTVFGATVPQIIGRFKWDYVVTGLVLASGSIGYVISSFSAGPILKRVPEKALVFSGLVPATAALCCFGLWESALINALLNMVIGFGQGFSEVVTNSLVIRLERKGESRLMNLMHAAYCVGAVAGPFAVGLMTAAGISFTVAFVAAGVLQGTMVILLMAQRIPRLAGTNAIAADAGSVGPAQTGATPDKNLSSIPDAATTPVDPGSAGAPVPALENKHEKLGILLRSPLLLVLASSLFLYVGIELAFSNWIAEYFVRFRMNDAAIGALMVSVYWAGLLVGRLGLSFLYKGKRQEYMLALLGVSSLVWFFTAVLVPNTVIFVVASFLTGLSFSGCYPIVMTIVGQYFKNSALAVGICGTAGGIGLTLFPLATGALAQEIGLAKALLAAGVIDLCFAAITVGLLIRRVRLDRGVAARQSHA